MRTTGLGTLASALLLVAATAAPVPKEALVPPLEKLYGKPDVGADTCTFKLDGRKLIIAIPATVEASAVKLSGAPRTKKEVTGDFEMEVSVSYKLPDPPMGAHAGAGLAIWQDDSRFALANRHHWPAGNSWTGGFDVHYEHPDGKRVSHGGGGCEGIGPETPARLRRQSDVVTTWESRDAGKTWNKMTESELKLPATVNVGVVAFNSLKAKMEVHCDAMTITPLGMK